MMIIKLYGERNTGNNYLAKLIERNFVVRQRIGVVPERRFWRRSERTKNLYFFLTERRNLGWKHSAVKFSIIQKHTKLDNIHFITLTKNAYSFLLSLYKRPTITSAENRPPLPSL